MANKKSKKEDVEAPKVEASKPKVKTTAYPLKVRLKVGGVWREKGETISLTKDGFRFYRSTKII